MKNTTKSHKNIYLPLKRLIGIFGSLFGIIVCAVFLWWWILLINTFSTKGHSIFRQERVGKDGKMFKLLKFRSMPVSVDPNLTTTESKQDVYSTKFGKFLRKTSLDETLQLFNIFIGQMAFIGPRPLIYAGNDIITIEKRKENGSICLRPGLSGYAQVHGRKVISADKKADFDAYYLEHISLLLDIKIFILSIFKSTK